MNSKVEVRFLVSRQFASHLRKLVRAENARERNRGYTTELSNAYVSEPDYPIIIATDPHTNRYQLGGRDPMTLAGLLRECPYGQPGDRVWVRETFYAYGRWETRFSAKKKRDEWHFVDMTAECDRRYQYAADNPDVPLAKARGGVLPGWYKRPAIFMPRAACRIMLGITGVHVERLSDISESDADAEGCERLDNEREVVDWALCDRCGGTRLHRALGANGGVMEDVDCVECDTYAKRYKHLWESINGAGSWAENQWVWVIQFKRVMV